MEWSDEAVILSVRRHGESGAIVDALTRTHGRHLGLVRGGASRAQRPVLMPGNGVQLSWRARLPEHLGNYTAELVAARAGPAMDMRDALAGFNAVSAVLSASLPERVPFPSVYAATALLMDAIVAGAASDWAPLYVRWEAGLLDALGFGLDLTKCAATGTTEELVYVSPRTGRAVSRVAGAPYAARMLALPGFLLASQNPVLPGDVAAGLILTGHFLFERVLRPMGRDFPPARLALKNAVA